MRLRLLSRIWWRYDRARRLDLVAESLIVIGLFSLPLLHLGWLFWGCWLAGAGFFLAARGYGFWEDNRDRHFVAHLEVQAATTLTRTRSSLARLRSASPTPAATEDSAALVAASLAPAPAETLPAVDEEETNPEASPEAETPPSSGMWDTGLDLNIVDEDSLLSLDAPPVLATTPLPEIAVVSPVAAVIMPEELPEMAAPSLPPSPAAVVALPDFPAMPDLSPAWQQATARASAPVPWGHVLATEPADTSAPAAVLAVPAAGEKEPDAVVAPRAQPMAEPEVSASADDTAAPLPAPLVIAAPEAAGAAEKSEDTILDWSLLP
jgi:hypothetical protein